VIQKFAEANWSIACVDFQQSVVPNTTSVLLDGQSSWPADVDRVREECKKAGFTTVTAVIHAGGSWAGSQVDSEDFANSLEHMWSANVRSAALAAHLAGTLLQKNGMLTLTGATPALDPMGTPGMAAYGMSKAATHHLLQSVSHGGLPEGCYANAILPTTIDTPANRAVMPDADTTTWTSPGDIADELLKWAEFAAQRTHRESDSFLTINNKVFYRPPHGSFVEIKTDASGTKFNHFYATS
jgi:NAD(P)-dependent dehydrogenase (short-subunit alcohol dehydrogenase family)